MEASASNLIFHELIGLVTEIIESKNPTLNNIKGRVVDETRNMLVIETEDMNEKMVPKQGTTFVFYVPSHSADQDQRVIINGKLLLSQPENRVKNIRKIRMR
ncbi:ribonuclease P protein component 1 [Methanococcoides methylutens]|uniref:ribonuclease P protein component 1 n=1 Tax=Methanococcoides methylutens TaxID=2226 RepID=UPI004044D7D8